MRSVVLRSLSLGIACLLFANLASATSDRGSMEVRVTDHKPAIAQFGELKVTLKEIALHQKGKGRRAGWVELPIRFPPIDIVPLKDGVFQSLGDHELPVGTYDAVRVRFDSATGKLKTGSVPTMLTDDTVVALQLTIKKHATSPLVIDLYAEDQTEHEPPVYVVKVKEVRRNK